LAEIGTAIDMAMAPCLPAQAECCALLEMTGKNDARAVSVLSISPRVEQNAGGLRQVCRPQALSETRVANLAPPLQSDDLAPPRMDGLTNRFCRYRPKIVQRTKFMPQRPQNTQFSLGSDENPQVLSSIALAWPLRSCRLDARRGYSRLQRKHADEQAERDLDFGMASGG
jgi:hypothetical protein